MKNLEDIFKKSLENHEMPYDPGLWDSLRKKTPHSKPLYQSMWFYPLIFLFSIGVSIFYLYNKKEVKVEYVQNNKIVSITNDLNKTNNPVKKENSKKENNNKRFYKKIKEEKIKTLSSKYTDTQNKNHIEIIDSIYPKNKTIEKNKSPNKTLNYIENNKQIEKNSTPNELYFNVKKQKICLGDTLKIKVKGVLEKYKDSYLLFENQKHYIKQNTLYIIPKYAGKKTITLISKSNQIKEKNIEIKEINKPNIYITKPNYENGLWVYKFESDNENIVWKINNKNISKLKSGKHVFTKSGEHEVLAELNSNFACSQNNATKIYVPSDKTKIRAQELLILNKNETFMPKDLQNMKNPIFELIIRNQKGQEIFKTNELSNPWDGKSRLTGRYVLAGQSVTWELIIKKNEFIKNHIYRGILSIINN